MSVWPWLSLVTPIWLLGMGADGRVKPNRITVGDCIPATLPKIYSPLFSDRDTLIQTIMAFIDIYSGESLSRSRIIQNVAFIWQLTVAVITTTSVIFIIVTGFNYGRKKWGFKFTFKLIFTSWYVANVLYMWLMVYGCHSKRGFE